MVQNTCRRVEMGGRKVVVSENTHHDTIASKWEGRRWWWVKTHAVASKWQRGRWWMKTPAIASNGTKEGGGGPVGKNTHRRVEMGGRKWLWAKTLAIASK